MRILSGTREAVVEAVEYVHKVLKRSISNVGDRRHEATRFVKGPQNYSREVAYMTTLILRGT